MDDHPVHIWNRLSFRIAVGLLAGALLMPAIGHAQPMGIPTIGAASGAELSPALETLLGDALMEQGRRDPTYIAAPEVNQYLTDMGHKLVSHAPAGQGQRITVFGIRDPQINAFAMPGGYVGIHSGLIASSQSEAELASVVAHEIAHVLQRHIARGMTQSSQSNTVLIASMVGALLAGLAGSGDLAMGVAAFGQAAAVDRQLGFSRNAEQEADRVGFEMMRNAGYDPRGMVRMFNRLTNASRLNESPAGGAYHSTHPQSVQRISDIENRVRNMPAMQAVDSDSFWYVRALLRVLQARGAQAQRQLVDSLNYETQQTSGVQQSAAWYGLAYAAWQRKALQEADTALDNARDSGRDSPQISRLSVLLALAQEDYAGAQEQAQAASTRWPEDQGLALAMVETLQKSNKDQQAIDALEQYIKHWPEIAQFHQLQAQSYERLGQQVQARQAMGRYYEMVGALPSAVEQLRQARNLSQDFYAQSELDVRIRTLRERLDSQRALLERFKAS
jgi:predicted Zn-dependent protease